MVISKGLTTRKLEEDVNVISVGPLPVLPNISIGQYLLNSMHADKNHVMQIDLTSGTEMTNGELIEKSVKLTQVLNNLGITIGDRVAIMSENHKNWLIPTCATLYVGAVIAPLNPLYTEYELKHLLNISKPKIIFVTPRTEKLVVQVVPSLPWSIQIISLDDRALSKGVPTMQDLLNGTKPMNVDNYKPVKLPDLRKAPATILCSSGTTGLPKGVTLSHRNLMCFLEVLGRSDYLDVRLNDRILVFLPFYHGYALGLLTMAIGKGATTVIMRTFERDEFLRAVGKYRITHLPLVPPVLVFLAKHPAVADCDFSSVREVICGAAPLPRDLAAEVKRRLNCQFIRNGYGMTELSIVICMSDRSSDSDEAVGYLVPGCLCKVIDQVTRETLPVNQVGELCFKGDQVMLGYWDNAEATAQTVDQQGWLYSGDLGYYDEKKRLHVAGRLKELIKYKAFQVSPAEVETVLLSHPGVKDGAVVGKPDEVSGELPMAFVVRQPGATVSAGEITEFVNGKLSPQKWLRGGVKFIDDIPKNPTGKILRKELITLASKL